jgi:hypothetical protein
MEANQIHKKFQNYFSQKYKNGKMFTDIKVDILTYRILKEFFLYYNQDNQTKTLGDNKPSNIYKIITLHDILSLKGDTSNSESPFIPIDWSTFFRNVQDIIINNKYTYKDTEALLNNLVDKIQNRKVNFKQYQSMYKHTFSKVFYRTIRDIFTIHTDINFMINKEFKY